MAAPADAGAAAAAAALAGAAAAAGGVVPPPPRLWLYLPELLEGQELRQEEPRQEQLPLPPRRL